jgi:hypothetical protein
MATHAIGIPIVAVPTKGTKKKNFFEPEKNIFPWESPRQCQALPGTVLLCLVRFKEHLNIVNNIYITSYRNKKFYTWKLLFDKATFLC